MSWPPGHRYVIGDRLGLGVTSYASRLRRFRCFRGVGWVVFIGLIRSRASGCAPQGVWVLLTDSGAVFGYDPDDDCVHLLTKRVSEFTQESVRAVPDFYGGGFVDPDREQAWYGHDPPSACREAMDGDPDALNVVWYARTFAGETLTNDSDDFRLTMGTEESLGAQDVLHPCVLTCLRDRGYSFIARSSKYSRFVLIDERTACVYVLMSGGFLFKVADSFSMLVRERLRSLERGTPTCFLPTNSDREYVPVGSQVSFGCTHPYCLPGDTLLLRDWVTRHTDITGWPANGYHTE